MQCVRKGDNGIKQAGERREEIYGRALPNEMEIPWDFQISTRGAVIAVFICTNLPMLQFLNKNCVLLWKDMDSTGRKDGIVVKVSIGYRKSDLSFHLCQFQSGVLHSLCASVFLLVKIC